MANSAQKNLRKKLAVEIESEILTLDVELQDIPKLIDTPSYKQLKVLNYDTLHNLRKQIQNIKRDIERLKCTVKRISKPDMFGSTVETMEEGQQVLIGQHTRNQLEKD